MFSIMTIASSTTNPVEIVSAINVRLFRLNPIRYIAANVPISDRGTAAAGMIGGRQGPEKQKNDHDDERDCEHEFKLDVADRGADRRRAVGQDGHLHGGGQGALQLRQELLDAVGDFNDVRARLPLDIDEHRRRLVHPGRLSDVLDVIGDLRHFGDVHRAAITIGDDERLIVAARQ